MNKCNHLKEFMDVQIGIIHRHIDEHKWCKKIADANDGVIDFIENYGWLMREVFCLYSCCDRRNCEIATKLRKDYQENEEDFSI